jgi:hypothetical protein
MSPVKYELGIYIAEDGILRSHRRENLKSYVVLMSVASVSEVTFPNLDRHANCPHLTFRSVFPYFLLAVIGLEPYTCHIFSFPFL